MKKILLVSGVLAIGGVALAASGDLIYITAPVTVEITGVQAANLADQFIALGAWDGSRSEMRKCTVRRSGSTFVAQCIGERSAPASTLDFSSGISVIGVEP